MLHLGCGDDGGDGGDNGGGNDDGGGGSDEQNDAKNTHIHLHKTHAGARHTAAADTPANELAFLVADQPVAPRHACRALHEVTCDV